MHISIIIPTCNRNDLLSVCLDSFKPGVQQVDGLEYEIIVTDDSVNNIAQGLIKEKYSGVKWVKGPKRGPAANRNNGAKVAKGEWLIFLDDDCIPDKDILSSYYDLVKNNNKVTVIEGLIYSDENTSPLFIAPVNLTGGHLWSCNFGIRRDIFENINGFDENYKYPN
jgi:GT2 family glycosyltransferase